MNIKWPHIQPSMGLPIEKYSPTFAVPVAMRYEPGDSSVIWQVEDGKWVPYQSEEELMEYWKKRSPWIK